MIAHPCTLGRLRLVQSNNILDVIGITEHSPQLHSDLRWEANELLSQVMDLLWAEGFGEDLGGL